MTEQDDGISECHEPAHDEWLSTLKGSSALRRPMTSIGLDVHAGDRFATPTVARAAWRRSLVLAPAWMLASVMVVV